MRLGVYDVRGRLIARPVDELRPAGDYVAVWEPGPRSSGLYSLRLEFEGQSVSKRVILIP